MENFSEYIEHLDTLVSRGSTLFAQSDTLESSIDAALDGQPARELRRLVPINNLRVSGAFFTGSKLSHRALRLLNKTINNKSVILDPACGAGDLLLACAAKLPPQKTLDGTLSGWGSRLIGRDLHTEFIQATKARLLLTALRSNATYDNTVIPEREDMFPNIKMGCGITDIEALGSASHIIINPPFTAIPPPEDCVWWGPGKVNAAAVFMASCVLHAKSNTHIVAILPDVLRSGTSYKKWRDFIESRSQINHVELYGRFDNLVNLDVFILELKIGPSTVKNNNPWHRPDKSTGDTVKDHFDICVGPVVDFRHKHRGLWHPFIKVNNLLPWHTIQDTSVKKRRFSGNVLSPPFVAIRRTSRSNDKHRAVGTIIVGKEPVAVENHLLVAMPKDGSLESCQKLLSRLKKPATSQWLNQRIRCRHLTVSSLAEIPW